MYFVEDEARNLSAEAARGLKMKCFGCGKRGAALGCCLNRCRRSYHYSCARALSCRWEEVMIYVLLHVFTILNLNHMANLCFSNLYLGALHYAVP